MRAFFITACGCYREIEMPFPCPDTFKLPLKFEPLRINASDMVMDQINLPYREFNLSSRTMKIGENFFPVYTETEPK